MSLPKPEVAGASANANANANALPPCEPVKGPLAEALRVGATASYVFVDTVDSHSVDGDGERSKGSVTYRVTTMACDGDVAVVSGAWTVDGEASLPSDLPDEWRLAHGRLVENAGALAFSEDELARARTPVCRVTTGRGPYGTSTRRLCVDRRGLVSLREENLHGPRTFVLTRR